MGRDYYAVAFVGYKIATEKITKEIVTSEKILSPCKCSDNNPNKKFCPTCGNNNIRINNKVSIIEYLKNYKHYSPNQNYVYVCLKLTASTHYEENEPVKKDNNFNITDEEKNKLIEEINQIEPFDENKFGFYTFIECSC